MTMYINYALATSPPPHLLDSIKSFNLPVPPSVPVVWNLPQPIGNLQNILKLRVRSFAVTRTPISRPVRHVYTLHVNPTLNLTVVGVDLP